MVTRCWEVTRIRRSRQQLIGLACRVVHLYRSTVSGRIREVPCEAPPNAVQLPPHFLCCLSELSTNSRAVENDLRAVEPT